MSLPIDLTDKNIDSQLVYVFGSKLYFENEFFLQIVDSEKKADRMRSFFLGKENTHWFELSFVCPVYMKAEFIPDFILKETKPKTNDNYKPLNFEF